jgi:hypothetical protein
VVPQRRDDRSRCIDANHAYKTNYAAMREKAARRDYDSGAVRRVVHSSASCIQVRSVFGMDVVRSRGL